jgi:hypothetical protein
MAFIPLPNTPSVNDPNPPFNIMLIVRVGGTLVYAIFAALGGYWLYFFNTQKVKAQFRRQQPFTEIGRSEVPGLLSAIPGVRFGPDQHTRPLSITIIGWYLIIASALGPLSIAFTGTFFPRFKLPLFLGFFPLWAGRIPAADCLDDCSDRRGGGIAKIKKLGPLYNHRPAMPGALEYDYDCRHSR